jgi:multicomponent Na+:H+ antiporter subunit D
MDGIGRQMPFTMGAFTIGALGLTGLPPVCGFISKWFLLLGAIEAKQIIFLCVFLISALLDAAYFFPVIYAAFFKKPVDINPHFDEAPILVVAPIVVTAIFSIIFFIFPDAFLNFFKMATMATQNILGIG